MIYPPVEKSGPGIIFIISFKDMRGLSIYAHTPSITSPRLCVGMLVASPTAMPFAPFTSRLGNLPGRMSGSSSESSKLKEKGTVSLSMSLKSSIASGSRRASVYLIAAAGSPSTEPKLPCPLTSVMRMLKSCAMRTIASYTELSPWGWYLPIQSPTIRADFLCGLSGVSPISIIVYRMRLCTGFKPSSTRGSALSKITNSA